MYEVATGTSGGEAAPQMVAHLFRQLASEGERVDGLSSQEILRRAAAKSLGKRSIAPASPRQRITSAPGVASGTQGLRPFQERLNAIASTGASHGVQSSGDLISKAQQILDDARREGRTKLSMTEASRFDQLVRLAEIPGQMRDGARNIRRGPARRRSYVAKVIS